ncbi:MAG: response regulator [Chloroflexi bacterium]|nr:response regulator [Chloroflexota bacterium]
MANVLVVDDSAFSRMHNAAIVKELGHEAIEAADGAQAVQAYKSNKPDAVLMDITMPGMDGLDALKAILAFDPDARVAMVTAMGQQSIVMEAIQSGARDFVVKPFGPDRLKDALTRLVGQTPAQVEAGT